MPGVGERPQAERAAADLLIVDPQNADGNVLAEILDRMLGLLNRGEELFSQGETAQARDHLEQLRMLTANSTRIHAHVLTDLAVIAGRAGDRGAAVELARQALVHQPDHPPALEVLTHFEGVAAAVDQEPERDAVGRAEQRERAQGLRRALEISPRIVTVAGDGMRIVHRGTPEDLGVLSQIFDDDCYSLDRLAAWTGLEAYKSPAALGGARPMIIDCGANIGASTVSFAHHYPEARVIAVEPERDNFSLLCENVASFINVRPLRRAIASAPGRLVLSDPGWGAWGYRTGAGVGDGTAIGEVIATSVVDLLEQERDAVPFILKVDIEGAEGDLFSMHGEALARFPLVIVELHDWMMPGAGTSDAFLRWHVSQGGRDFVHHGENIFSLSRDLLRAQPRPPRCSTYAPATLAGETDAPHPTDAAAAPDSGVTPPSEVTPDSRILLGHRSYIFKPPTVTSYEGDPDHPIVIGAYCSIFENVEFMIGGNHRTDWVSTFPLRGALGLPGADRDGHPASKEPIVIGNDVWIAKNVQILSGVRIGDGAVVGAGSVVTRDVRPYAIVAGNPAREIRRRFDDEVVDELLVIAWWNWSDDEVVAAQELLNGGSIGEFLAYAHARGWATGQAPVSA